MTNLTLPIFTDPEAARAHLEALYWPDGPVCPHCGTISEATLVNGKSHRQGMYQCNACRSPFSITVGTVMESSHVPLNKWVLGFHLMAASKKGMSAHQLMRMLGLGSYRSAWFMAMRIREAMAPAKNEPLGGKGQIVEADEVELGRSPKTKRRAGRTREQNKKFVTLVERGGKVRSRKITGAKKSIWTEVHDALHDNLHPDTKLHTDGARMYRTSWPKQLHEAVDHDKMFGRTTDEGEKVHTNTAEGYFSIFKRGLVGTYQHMSEQHLPRYLAEFDFRMNNRERLGVNDTARAGRAMKGAVGKRLMYQGPATDRL